MVDRPPHSQETPRIAQHQLSIGYCRIQDPGVARFSVLLLQRQATQWPIPPVGRAGKAGLFVLKDHRSAILVCHPGPNRRAPTTLFLIVGLTIEAKRRYFAMSPAFAGRLQNSVRIDPIKTVEGAITLSDFYLADARAEAARESAARPRARFTDPIPKADIQTLFRSLYQQAAAEKAQEGVTPRDLLHALHQRAEDAILALQ